MREIFATITTREQAIFIWICVLFAVAAIQRSITFRDLKSFRVLISPKIIVLLMSIFGAVFLCGYLLTIPLDYKPWMVKQGVGLSFAMIGALSGYLDYSARISTLVSVKSIIVQFVKLSTVVAIVTSSYTMSLPVELVVVFAIALLTAMVAYFSHEPTAQRVRVLKFVTVLILLVLGGIITYSAIRFAEDLAKFNVLDVLSEVLWEPTMTLLTLPLLLVWAIVSSYEQLFIHIPHADVKLRRTILWSAVRFAGWNRERLYYIILHHRSEIGRLNAIGEVRSFFDRIRTEIATISMCK